MELNKVNVHETKGSFFVYIPKIWVKQMNLKKGDKMSWNIKEKSHETLELRKLNEGRDVR